MKKLFKKLVVLALVLVSVLSLSITAFAWDYEMEIGETSILGPSETPYVSSDPYVIEIWHEDEYHYTAVAVGEGTALITGGSWMGVESEPCIMTVYDPELEEIEEFLTFFFAAILVLYVGFVIVFGIVCCVAAVLIIVFMVKRKKLNNAMLQITLCPSQETVDAAIEAFIKTSSFVRKLFSMGAGQNSMHFIMWRETFNRTVIPAANIDLAAKEALKQQLIRFNTFGLYNVVVIQKINGPQPKDTFASKSKDHLWNELKSLSGCDVYRDVRLGDETSGKIDAVIVDESKGIFLIQSNCVAGAPAPDGNQYIAYNMLAVDPGKQIYRQEADFTSCFADMDLASKIKKVLVFSWPAEEPRRLLNKASFPQVEYDIITVEQLVGYFKAQPMAEISAQERKQLSEKLKLCSSECIVR